MYHTLACLLLLVLVVTGVFPLLLTGFSTTGTGSGSGAAMSSEKQRTNNNLIGNCFKAYEVKKKKKRKKKEDKIGVTICVLCELTIFLVAVLVRVCVAILVTVCFGESRDV